MKVNLTLNKQKGAITLLTGMILLISITLISLLTAKTVLVETQITADNYRTSQAEAAASAAMDQAVAYFNAGGFDQHNNTTPTTLTADGLVDYIGPGPFGGIPLVTTNTITSTSGGVVTTTPVTTLPTEPTATSCSMPTTTTFPLILTSGAQTTYAQFYYNNTDDNGCDCQSSTVNKIDGDSDGDCMGTLGTNMTRGLVIAKGWSDDCTAVRTISQCVGTFNVFDSSNGVQQPAVSKPGVGVFGNATLINRYNNSLIWSGGSAGIHGASFGTYLLPSNKTPADLTSAELDNPDQTLNTQLVSNKTAGDGIDVVTNDPTIANKTISSTNLTDPALNQFFDMFFSQTKAEIKNAADNINQLYTAGPVGKTGLIWVEGNAAYTNTDIVGTPSKPAILIVNGDLTLNGGSIYGVVYVTGQLKITGNPVVIGSIATESTSTGAGNLTLVYKPWGSGNNQAPPFITGTGAVIAGSWKDW